CRSPGVLFLFTRTSLVSPSRFTACPGPGGRGAARRVGGGTGAGAAPAGAAPVVALVGSRRLERGLGLPAARAGRSVTGTGRHSHKRSENRREPQVPNGACRRRRAQPGRGGGPARSAKRSFRGSGPAPWAQAFAGRLVPAPRRRRRTRSRPAGRCPGR